MLENKNPFGIGIGIGIKPKNSIFHENAVARLCDFARRQSKKKSGILPQ